MTFFFLSVPLAVTAPAVLAVAAYLNARSSLWYDLLLLKCVLTGTGRMFYRERVDRLNFFYLLESYAQNETSARRDLLIFEGKHLTYADVYDSVLRYGHWMRTKLGVKPGDIVAMDFQNSDTFIFVWFGLWSIGAKPAMINYNLSGASLSHCLKTATTKLCLVDANVAGNVGDDVRAEVSHVNFVVFTPELLAEIEATDPVRSPDSDRSEAKLSSMAILIYTSGTTGMPKAATVSWGKCIVGGSFSGKLIDLTTDDIMYTVSFDSQSCAQVKLIICIVNAPLPLICRHHVVLFHHSVRQHASARTQVFHQDILERCTRIGSDIDPICRRDITLSSQCAAAVRPGHWRVLGQEAQRSRCLW